VGYVGMKPPAGGTPAAAYAGRKPWPEGTPNAGNDGKLPDAGLDWLATPSVPLWAPNPATPLLDRDFLKRFICMQGQGLVGFELKITGFKLLDLNCNIQLVEDNMHNLKKNLETCIQHSIASKGRPIKQCASLITTWSWVFHFFHVFLEIKVMFKLCNHILRNPKGRYKLHYHLPQLVGKWMLILDKIT
jgi:hypothetical protein